MHLPLSAYLAVLKGASRPGHGNFDIPVRKYLSDKTRLAKQKLLVYNSWFINNITCISMHYDGFRKYLCPRYYK
jgi:hypothetical protein